MTTQDPLAPIQDTPGLPRVLLLGDSISVGYTLPVRELLNGKANIHRPPDNCSATRHGLDGIDRWLGDGSWDVIHFNWGLHDLAFVDDQGKRTVEQTGRHQVPIDQYETNLNTLVERLKADRRRTHLVHDHTRAGRRGRARRKGMKSSTMPPRKTS